jgi:hypothetical protein
MMRVERADTSASGVNAAMPARVEERFIFSFSITSIPPASPQAGFNGRQNGHIENE